MTLSTCLSFILIPLEICISIVVRLLVKLRGLPSSEKARFSAGPWHSHLSTCQHLPTVVPRLPELQQVARHWALHGISSDFGIFYCDTRQDRARGS